MESINYVVRSKDWGGITGSELNLDLAVKGIYPKLPAGKRIFINFTEFSLFTDPVSISTAAEFLMFLVDLKKLKRELVTITTGVITSADEYPVDIIPISSFTDEFNQYSKIFQEPDKFQFSFIYDPNNTIHTHGYIRKDDNGLISNVKELHSVVKLKLSFAL